MFSEIYTQEENKIRKPNIGQQIFFADIHFPRNDHWIGIVDLIYLSQTKTQQ